MGGILLKDGPYPWRKGAEMEELLKTPDEWCEVLNAEILDRDGWRNEKKSWDDPITKREFDRLIKPCTINMLKYPYFIKSANSG